MKGMVVLAMGLTVVVAPVTTATVVTAVHAHDAEMMRYHSSQLLTTFEHLPEVVHWEVEGSKKDDDMKEEEEEKEEAEEDKEEAEKEKKEAHKEAENEKKEGHKEAEKEKREAEKEAEKEKKEAKKEAEKEKKEAEKETRHALRGHDHHYHHEPHAAHFARTLQEDTESFIADLVDWIHDQVGPVNGSKLHVDTEFTLTTKNALHFPCGDVVAHKTFPVLERFLDDPAHAQLSRHRVNKILWRPSRHCLYDHHLLEVDGGAHAEFEVSCGTQILLNASVASGGVTRNLFWHTIEASGALVSVDFLHGTIKAIGASGPLESLIKYRHVPADAQEILKKWTHTVRDCAAKQELSVRGVVGGGWRQKYTAWGSEDYESVVGYAEAFELTYKPKTVEPEAGEATLEPSVTTEAPVTEGPATEVPVATTPAVEAPVTEAPTDAPTLTDAPVTDTEAPVAGTETPFPETEVPVVETEVPVVETEAPVAEGVTPTSETVAPINENDAPVAETETPIVENGAPVKETETPVPETEAPVGAETEAPVTEIETPVKDITEAPVHETEAPAADTEAPVHETKAPAADNEAPVHETEAPAADTEAPVKDTEAPVHETEAPVKDTEAPAHETEAPAADTEASVNDTEAPVHETEAPVKDTEARVHETEAPVADTEAPVHETEAPAADNEAPVHETVAPAADTEVPVHETEVPAADTEAPVNDTEAPAADTEAPVKDTEAPVKESEVAAAENESPTSTTDVNADETTAPVADNDSPREQQVQKPTLDLPYSEEPFYYDPNASESHVPVDLASAKLKELSQATSAMYVHSGMQCRALVSTSNACVVNTALAKIGHGPFADMTVALTHKMDDQDLTRASSVSLPLFGMVALMSVCVFATFRTTSRRQGYQPIRSEV